MNELNLCHYCGSLAIQSTHADINIMCHNQVEMWDLFHNVAVEKAVRYWNGEE